MNEFNEINRILVYKRTHTDDPDQKGRFGCCDCMGRIRALRFDAVIGVGGKRPWRGSESIAERITWVGIGRREKRAPGKRGPILTFSRFFLCNDSGPLFKVYANSLYRRLFNAGARYVLNMSNDELVEARNILTQATAGSLFPISTQHKSARSTNRCR